MDVRSRRAASTARTGWRGKWALVTGASAGIGRELARQLAAGGANLVLTARRGDRLAQLALELTASYKIQVETFPADLVRPDTPREIFRFTQQKQLPIEVLVNNAGFGKYGEFFRADSQRLLEMLQVNVAAVVSLTHLYLPAMAERRSGYVLIVSSTAAYQAVPYISTYAATKAFELIFAEGVAEEMRDYGVNVCCLCPGSTETEFQQVAGQPPRTARRRETAEKVARVGLEALANGRPRVISGRHNRVNVEMQRLVPRSVVTRIAARLFAPRAPGETQ
jgi:short-subunit dehydrogenase